MRRKKEEKEEKGAKTSQKKVIKCVGNALISCKWVYRIKCYSDGSMEQFKAKLVVFGNHQQASIDYV